MGEPVFSWGNTGWGNALIICWVRAGVSGATVWLPIAWGGARSSLPAPLLTPGKSVLRCADCCLLMLGRVGMCSLPSLSSLEECLFGSLVKSFVIVLLFPWSWAVSSSGLFWMYVRYQIPDSHLLCSYSVAGLFLLLELSWMSNIFKFYVSVNYFMNHVFEENFPPIVPVSERISSVVPPHPPQCIFGFSISFCDSFIVNIIDVLESIDQRSPLFLLDKWYLVTVKLQRIILPLLNCLPYLCGMV